MSESKRLTFSPFAGLSGVRYPAHTPRPGRVETVTVRPGVVVKRRVEEEQESLDRIVPIEAEPSQRDTEALPPAKSVEVAGEVNVLMSKGAPVKEMGSDGPEREQAEVVSGKKLGNKKRRRRMHEPAFIEKVIAAAKRPGAVLHRVGKEFDVSPTLVSRWVEAGVPRLRGKKPEPPSLEKMGLPSVVKGSSGVAGLDRVVLLLEESKKHQAEAARFQIQALEELGKLSTALRLVFQGK